MAGKPEAIDVVVVGSCNVDLIRYYSAEVHLSKIMKVA